MRTPSDPRFPHIASVFDTSRMQVELQQAWFADGNAPWTIESLEIEETVYRPGDCCVVLWRVGLRHAASGAPRQQLAFLHACRIGEGPQAYARARAMRLVPADDLPPFTYLPALEALVWTFPNDPKLPGLPAMLDLSQPCEALFEGLDLPELLTGHARRDIAADVMHYQPEDSCMVRYRLVLEDPSTGERKTFVVYGKTYAEGDVAKMHRIVAQLTQQSQGLRTARPLGYGTGRNVLWQSHVAGDPVSLSRVDADASEVFQGIGRCLAAFHRSEVVCELVFDPAGVLGRLGRIIPIIAKMRPEFTERMCAIERRLTRVAGDADFADTPLTPVHRDLKSGNFLWDSSTAALIDMDNVQLGDPLSDLGSFIVTLSTQAMQIGWDEDAIERMIGHVLDAYASEAPWPVRCRRLDWYMAASFVYESTWRSVRQWDQKKQIDIPAYLALAERHALRCEAQGAQPPRRAPADLEQGELYMSVHSRTRSLAEISHKIVRRSRIVEETLHRLVAEGRPLSVLEVGFGWGRALTELAWMFRDRPIEFHGVDIACQPPVRRSEDLRGIAQRFETVPESALADFRVPQLHFYDATRLHFEDERLDLIYSAVTIRFFERKAEFLEEVCRVLRPGGFALLQLGEKNWDYPYGPAGDPPALTPYRARLVLRYGDHLFPVPEYFRLFEGDRFRFTFTRNTWRCSLLIEKLKPGRLCLDLSFNARLSGPIADIPSWTGEEGRADDGYRSVYDIQHAIPPTKVAGDLAGTQGAVQYTSR